MARSGSIGRNGAASAVRMVALLTVLMFALAPALPHDEGAADAADWTAASALQGGAPHPGHAGHSAHSCHHASGCVSVALPRPEILLSAPHVAKGWRVPDLPTLASRPVPPGAKPPIA